MRRKFLALGFALVLIAALAVPAFSATMPLYMGPGPVCISPGMEAFDTMTGLPRDKDGYEACENLPEAAVTAGFPMLAPESVTGYQYRNIAAKPGTICISYSGCFNGLSVWKSTGDPFPALEAGLSTTTWQVGPRTVTVYEQNGSVRQARWTFGKYYYCFYAGFGQSEDTAKEIIAQIW